nr:hypothetical protein [Tanacetum cinerariifolium]
MNNFSMGAYLLVLLVLLVAFSPETHAQTCSKSDHPISLTEPNPGECNTENSSECCKQDILYDTYTCSPPVSSETSATLTLNSFEEGGDGGAESQCDEQFHSDNELVVTLSTGWYEGGARCNRWITINGNGQSVKAMVVDECDSIAGCDKEHAYQPPCRYNVVDASKGVWEALGVSEENLGELEITRTNTFSHAQTNTPTKSLQDPGVVLEMATGVPLVVIEVASRSGLVSVFVCVFLDTVQLETAVNTISHEYLLEFTSEYGIPEPGPEDRIVDFPEGKVSVYTRFFEFANFRFPLSQFLFDVPDYYQIHLSQLSVIGAAIVSHFEINCCVLNIIPTLSLFRVFYTQSFNSRWMSFSKRPGKNTPKCYTKPQDSLKNWNNRFFWVDERVFPTVVDWRTNASKDGMPTEGTLIRCPIYNREVPVGLFPRGWGFSPGDCRPRDAAVEGHPVTGIPEAGQAEETAATDPPTAPESRSSHGGKSLAAIQLGLASTVFVPEDVPAGVSDPDPLSVADPPSRHPADVAQSSQGTAAAKDPESESTSSPVEVGSPESIYRPEWGVVNGSLLDTPEACQDLVDHVAPPGYFSKLRHLHNDEFFRRYNINLARQVAMGSQLRLRFEQEAKLLRKSVAQVARRDKRIQARELEIKNLEALLEAEVNTKKAAEDRSAGLSQELENMRAQFSDLQMSNGRLSQQVATLQQQVSGEEKLKAAFEEFKRQQDERVEQRCAEMDARLDALSIDFDEELYPHILTAIAGRRWVIGRGLRLAVMKCGESLELRQAFVDAVSAGIAKGLSEGLRHGLEHGQAQLSLESIEAYDPEAEAKFVAALQALKDLKFPLVDH